MPSSTAVTAVPREETPTRGDLKTLMKQHPLPSLEAGLVDPASMAGDAALTAAQAVLEKLNTAIAIDDAEAVAACFYQPQAWWKDCLALTYHLRTFNSPRTVAAALLETSKLRGLGAFTTDGSPMFIPATPFLQFIDCALSFRTTSPATTCTGKVVLLPIKDANGAFEWKVWCLFTRLDCLDLHPEDASLLQTPAKALGDTDPIETDVLILGAGNAAAALAASLKAVGVESIMAEKNANVGDNWALRYDCMKFHVPTSFCELPFLSYGESLQAPHLLSRMDLAEHLQAYVKALHLNVITSVKLQSTVFDPLEKRWTSQLETPAGIRTVVSKHFVQATGIGSQKPNVPQIADADSYKGIAIHSADFRNGGDLVSKGVKSVIIVGSANTAFDVLEDCHAAGLQATMNVRSPTFICPTQYVLDQRSLGAYDLGVAAADRLFLSFPTAVDSSLAKGLFHVFASQEPDRYKPLAEAGFPVLDATDPDSGLMSNLIERAGGHYMDIGGTDLIAKKKVGVKAHVEPKTFTPTGLKFSDDSTLDADAVIWCTGFRDVDVSKVATEILGGSAVKPASGQLGLEEIAARMDSTWGIDAEGEVRGMWKRHTRLAETNYWIMGGYTQQHRYHSKTLALQIKAELEGVLPPAYTETPSA